MCLCVLLGVGLSSGCGVSMLLVDKLLFKKARISLLFYSGRYALLHVSSGSGRSDSAYRRVLERP